MADQGSRRLQDLLEAAESSMANDAATPATTTTESDDMDYEPATEEESEDINNEAFLERLLAGGDAEDDDEDDEGSKPYSHFQINIHLLTTPHFRGRYTVHGDRSRDLRAQSRRRKRDRSRTQ
jgi:hypothetical protein